MNISFAGPCFSCNAEQLEKELVFKSDRSIIGPLLEEVEQPLAGASAARRRQDLRYEPGQICVQRLTGEVERDRPLQFFIGSGEQFRLCRVIGRNQNDGNALRNRRLHHLPGAGAAVRSSFVPNRDKHIDIRQDDLVGAFIAACPLGGYAGQYELRICAFNDRACNIRRW